MATHNNNNNNHNDLTRKNRTSRDPDVSNNNHTKERSPHTDQPHQRNEDEDYPHGRRGFASMDPEKQREIASKGGKASHTDSEKDEEGSSSTAHETSTHGTRNHERDKDEEYPHGRRGFAAMDPEKQREIASKGGSAPHEVRGFQAMDPAKQREIASKGGRAAHIHFTPDRNKGRGSTQEENESDDNE